MGIDNSIAAVLPYGRFAPDTQGEVDLRGSGITQAFFMRGPSYESTTDAQRVAVREQLSRAMLHLGSGDFVHWVFHRIEAPEPTPRTFPSVAARLVDEEHRARFAAGKHWLTLPRLYLSHQYESAVRQTVRDAVFSRADVTLDAAARRKDVHQRFAGYVDASAGLLGLRRMNNAEMLRDLRLAVTGLDYPALVPEDGIPLNEMLSPVPMTTGKIPKIGDFYVRPINIVTYPTVTIPQMLAAIFRHPGNMTLSGRFVCLDNYDGQKQLELEVSWWEDNRWGSMWDRFRRALGKPPTRPVNQDILNQIADANAALAAAAAGVSFGWPTITVIVRDIDPQQATVRARAIVKDLSALGIGARIEDVHASHTVYSSWPGDGWHNKRRPKAKASNFIDLMLPNERWIGTPEIDSEFYDHEPAPLITSGTGLEPFCYPTHVNGVANQLIIGPSGTGKSGLIGAMVCAYLGIPNVRIAWLDLDYSSFVLTHLLDNVADYHDMGAEDTPALCPLAFLDRPNGLEYLYGFFERLFAQWNLELDERQSEEFAFALREARRTGVRTLSGLRSLIDGGQGKIRRILRHYTTYWKHIFDGEPRSKETKQVTIYELRGLIGLGKRVAAPATELILHSIVSDLDGSAGAFIFCDEFWQLLGNNISAEWLFDAIRTMRKKNCGFVGASQSLVEIVNSPYRDLLLESMPGKVLLPNSELQASAYIRETYMKLGLSDHEIDLIGGATPREQYLFRSNAGNRLFTLKLGTKERAICGSTGFKDLQAAKQLIAEHGQGGFLNAWLDTRLNGVAA